MKGQVLPEILALGSGDVVPSVNVSVSSPLCHSQQHDSLWRRNGESARSQTERPAGLLLPGEGLSSTLSGTCLTPHLFLLPSLPAWPAQFRLFISTVRCSAVCWGLGISSLRGERNLSGAAREPYPVSTPQQ